MKNTTERQFFSGNTVEQAVLAAARHYGLDPDRVAYRLRDKKHGFVNVRRRVVIEVDPEAPERSEAAAEPAAESPRRAVGPQPVRAGGDRARRQVPAGRGREEDHPPSSWRGRAASWEEDGVEDGDRAAIERALEEIVSLLGLDLEASIRRDDEGLEVELAGGGSDALLADEGALLDAIEHLLPRMVRGLVGRSVLCRLDSGGFRAAHREKMHGLAERAAAEVRRDMQSRILEPMNPADRRLVHLALAEDPTVRTESEGGGFMKRVRISPA